MGFAPKLRTYKIGEYSVGVDERTGVMFDLRRGLGLNVLDAYDAGRGVQQSVYGDPNNLSFLWGSQPWTRNAIEGGRFTNAVGDRQVATIRKTALGLTTETEGVNWASGAPERVVFKKRVYPVNGGKALGIQQSIEFGDVWSGEPENMQECPAMFLDARFRSIKEWVDDKWIGRGSLKRLAVDMVPTHHAFGRINDTSRICLADANGFCVDITAPTKLWASYSFLKPGQTSACSYIAPLRRFAWGQDQETTVVVRIGWIK